MNRNYYNCIICGAKIKAIDFDTSFSPIIENMMWHKGVVATIQMPYGSKFDGNEYVIGLCDNCIEQMEKEKIIKAK